MSQPYVGQIAIFAFSFAPRGWAFCQGQLMAISQHTTLFSILGATYGGNGVSTFALPRLQGFKDIHAQAVEIHRLENEGDRIVRGAITSLFKTGIDPIVVIRWKDIFERLEQAIDSSERVAYILEGIVIKNA